MTWPEDLYDLRNLPKEERTCQFMIPNENPYKWRRCGEPAKPDLGRFKCVKHRTRITDAEVTK